MSLVHKIRGYVLLIVSLLTIIVALSVTQISTISTTLSRVSSPDNPAREALQFMNKNLDEVREAVDYYYLSGNITDIDKAERAEKVFEDFYSKYKRVAETKSEKRFVEELSPLYTELKKAGEEITLLVERRREVVDKIKKLLAEGEKMLQEKTPAKNKIRSSINNILSISLKSFKRYPSSSEDLLHETFLLSMGEARRLVKEYEEVPLSLSESEGVKKLKTNITLISTEASTLSELARKLKAYIISFDNYAIHIDKTLEEQIWKPIDIDVANFAGELREKSRVSILVVFILGGVFIIIAALTSWILSRTILNPISSLIKGTEIFGSGDFSYRLVIPQGEDEFAKLGAAFNDMSQKIESSTKELKDSHDDLERRVARRTEQLQRINDDLEEEISKRSKKEEELKESHRRFVDFAETAGDWFWEFDSDMRLSYVSDRFEHITGIPPEEFMGKTRREILAKQVIFDDKLQQETHLTMLSERKPYVIQCMWLHKDGSTRIIRDSGKPVFNLVGQFTGYRSTVADITVSYHLTKQLDYQKTHDPLTGLRNRRTFEKSLSALIESVSVEHGAEHVLCLIDLDQFRIINESCGHLAGDELLRQLGNLFYKEIRKVDLLARLGGDEFGLIMEYCPISQANSLVEKLCKLVEEHKFSWNNNSFRLSISAGLVPINEHSKTAADVMIAADAACYAAKKLGRNRVHIYQENDAALVRLHSDITWVTNINRALEKERFCIYYQPIVPVDISEERDRKANSYEIFIRMLGKNDDLIMPGEFLPAAEMYDLSEKLDRWMIRNTLRWLSSNPMHLEKLKHCFINLSGKSIGDEGFLSWLKGVFIDYGVAPEKICFEVTETSAIANLTDAIYFINELKKIGCLFAIDDFGTGFSSFTYLKNLPADFLKIDGEFVKNILENKVDMSLVKSISEIGKIMGKKVIAEFVENMETAEALKGLGVDFIQGYAISKPKPLDDLIA
jgi:diguanylate cyclase (GGDEF)-like protein/PAS domain S-box-containing protein